MSHTRDHIIIQSIRATVSTDEHSTTSKVRVWHAALALLLIGWIVGKVF